MSKKVTNDRYDECNKAGQRAVRPGISVFTLGDEEYGIDILKVQEIRATIR